MIRQIFSFLFTLTCIWSWCFAGGIGHAFAPSPATPQLWGEDIPGVRTHLNTQEPVIALTLDACGGKRGNGFDKKLINWLRKHHIPATLFITGRWINANEEIAKELASSPLFEIENHGMNHCPCSVSGRSAYGIPGTGSVEEVMREVSDATVIIKKVTNRQPRFFRSGTNYYDEVALALIEDLGYNVVGYSIAGDEGATLSEDAIVKKLLQAKAGNIILCHMNQPESDTAEGLITVIPMLQKKGFCFVTLQEYPLR